MRTGVRLGIDVGKARIGVARCDPDGLLATPLETVPRAGTDERPGRPGREEPIGGYGPDVTRILTLAGELGAIELIVGLPLGLSGHRTPSTEDAERFAQRLAQAGETPVRLIDERLTTVSAQGQLRQAGKRQKQTRGVIDQAAAVVILQHALDSERAGNRLPGTVVETETGEESA